MPAGQLCVRDGGRTLLVNHRFESDIWLLSLDDAAERRDAR